MALYVCVRQCVCHKLVLCQNGCTDRASFGIHVSNFSSLISDYRHIINQLNLSLVWVQVAVITFM